MTDRPKSRAVFQFDERSLEIFCPQCKRHMEVGKDPIAGDYYAQCRNPRCSFDGACSNQLETLCHAVQQAASPLPYKIDEYGDVKPRLKPIRTLLVEGFSLPAGNHPLIHEARSNTAYLTHAANVLPGLVEACKYALVSLKDCEVSEDADTIKKLRAALEAAENVTL